MQTAHHHHHLSGLSFPYNLNLASAAPPLCHGYPLIYNAATNTSAQVIDDGAYYHAVKPSSTTAGRVDTSSGSATDDEEYASVSSSSPRSTHSPPRNSHHVSPPSTTVGYPSSLPAECAAMMPLPSACQRQQQQHKRVCPPGDHRGFAKSFTIKAILGLDNRMMGVDNRMMASNDPTNNFNKINNKVAGVERQHAGSKRFIFKKSGTEFRRNLNVKLTDKVAKSKRVRTIFTPEQLERLENEFERQQYMVGPERLYLASSLNLTEAQVKVWFQNRRIKWRKHHLELQQAQLAKIRETSDDAVHREGKELMPLMDDPNTVTSEDDDGDD